MKHLKVIVLLFMLAPIVSFSQDLEGKVVAITDGDTFKLLTKDSTLVRIRLANIDCPEKKQPFFKKAKEFTSNSIFGKTVQIEVLKLDRYGRTIGFVKFDGNKDLSEELLKNGLAWHFVKYSKDKIYQELEDVARVKKKGLWSDPNPVAPWDWRKKRKN